MRTVKALWKSGFSLVELAVVVVIIGALAAFAVPRFRASVERSKAAEAFNYLSAVQAAQERYHARQSTYADTLTALDIQLTAAEVLLGGHPGAGKHGRHPGLLDADADPERQIRRLWRVHGHVHGAGV